jgi:hypothetical protein
MVAKIKAKFIPKDYQITLFRRSAEFETEDDVSEGIH